MTTTERPLDRQSLRRAVNECTQLVDPDWLTDDELGAIVSALRTARDRICPKPAAVLKLVRPMSALDNGILEVCAADARREVHRLMKTMNFSDLSTTEAIAFCGILRSASERVNRKPAPVLQLTSRRNQTT